ncbi:phosphosulfolactate synthase [Paenibacillus sp. XY044]|uniref:phosphosulfolactate synthase n=1 Tax=Paenibacillus sp. XY044 TaxID=2026089 RepID=UPI000B99782E|nr:phosphosulfolactate synthase [Paenibacillus sp. XY044]OZB95340.1 phosphosulfolactate synthase [Paenibacillus sp. XY044]
MNNSMRAVWPRELCDPSGSRDDSDRETKNGAASRDADRGMTMVIDKGLGRNAFADMIETASAYIDCIKFGFGTAPLYKTDMLLYKIDLAKQRGISVMTGGTLLEMAVQQNIVPAFFDAVCNLGFNALEVSDGTIELSRHKRTELIREGKKRGLRVFTEYGKKLSGSLIDAAILADTVELDLAAGAEYVTVEARESGVSVGIFDKHGECREDVLDDILKFVPDIRKLIWEAPLKNQQAMLLRKFGSNVHLGNIASTEVLALETLRRGLRQDTFEFGVREKPSDEFCYMI